MTGQIMGGAAPIYPDMILGYESSREGGSLVHPILGTSNPDVSLRPAQLRTGMLSLAFLAASAEADSKAAEDQLSTVSVFTLLEDQRTTIGMRFVVSGPIRRALDPESRSAWTVEVDYTEVAS